MASAKPQLNRDHLDYLAQRAVPAVVARADGLRSVTAVDGAKLLGFDKPLRSGGLAIPYLEKGSADAWRVRMDDPGEDGPKFLTAAGQHVRPYFPPSLSAKLLKGKDASIVIVEGPIKALALTAAGLPSIGLGGVTAGGPDSELWKEKGQLTPHGDIQRRLRLQGRPTTILFDAGRLKNPMVAIGEAMLAAAFRTAGAVVNVAALPLGSGQADYGPDDYLKRKGKRALSKIIGAAQPADPLERVRVLELVSDFSERVDRTRSLLSDICFVASLHLTDQATRDLVAERVFKLTGIGKAAIREAIERFRASLGARADPPGSKKDGVAAGLYETTPDGIIWHKPTRDGSSPVLLTNFTAAILTEVENDDGAEIQRSFEIEVTAREGKARIVLPSSRFGNVSQWSIEALGAQAVVHAGIAAQDHARAAIQS